MNLSIEKAIIQDAEAVYELICDLENTYYSKESFTEIFETNFNNPQIGYFVAKLNEFTVGFGSIYINKLLHHCGNIAEIQELIVSNEYRNKNIGNNIVRKMVEWSKKQGALQVEVTCNITRTKAQKFYKANGFIHTHQKLVLKVE